MLILGPHRRQAELLLCLGHTMQELISCSITTLCGGRGACWLCAEHEQMWARSHGAHRFQRVALESQVSGAALILLQEVASSRKLVTLHRSSPARLMLNDMRLPLQL